MQDHQHDTPNVEGLWRRIRVLERRRLDRVLVVVGSVAVFAVTEPLLSVIDARGKRVAANGAVPATQAPPVAAVPAVERESGAIGWGKPADDGKEDDSFDWMD